MKHILSLFLCTFFSLQAFGQPPECAEIIAYEQDESNRYQVFSDLYPVGYCYDDLDQGDAEKFIVPQFVLEDFVLSEYRNINTVCFPGSFCYNDGPEIRGDNNSSYRTDVCDPYAKTFEVTYYTDFPEPPMNLNNYIYAGPFTVTTSAEHIIGTPYYQFTGMHDVVNFPLNTKFWVSIQNIDDDNCEFQMLYSQIESLQDDRTNINTRNLANGFYTVENIGGQTTFYSRSCINFALGATGLAPIPTLSQWGIIILGLLVIVFGVSFVRKEQLKVV